MKRVFAVLSLVIGFFAVPDAWGYVVLKGRLQAARYVGSGEVEAMMAVRCFANAAGGESQAMGFRTWETYPAGWYFLTGAAGNYSMVFSAPAGFVRPKVLTNQFMADGDVVDRVVTPVFDYADFYQGGWDEKAARGYWQTFVARGTSITQVGFKLATDGVDGPGPAGQNILISVHNKGVGTPDKWEQVGPTGVVLNVDCGGAKNYWWSAGWDSGEVVTAPGEDYAVCLRPEKEGNSFQAFWRKVEGTKVDCYRVGADGSAGWQGTNLCMAVGADSDGLVIPYNKRVHKEYKEFAGFAGGWSQTYLARGKSLASVILYAACSGTQPSMNRQRLRVRLRKGGVGGEIVGVEKIAIGNGNYTGDASWGVFGVSFAPGEVVLTPGERYAVEFMSMENYNTLSNFVNIKGQASDLKAGFNPYRKCAPDSYADGRAYRNCRDGQDFDLDMQIIEYEHGRGEWGEAVEGANLIANGDMEAGGEMPSGWGAFKVAGETGLVRMVAVKEKDNAVGRVYGGSSTGKEADGGYVQGVKGLSKLETYRLRGKVRSTWPVDEKHACMVGFDRTGQVEDAEAETVEWTVLPRVSGVFVDYESGPVRPAGEAISVWLRGRTTLTDDYRFEADFDDFELRKVDGGVPGKGSE